MCCGWGGWMGGWGGFGIFGWFLGLIFSLGLLVIFIVGIVWLVRQVSGSRGIAMAPPRGGETTSAAAGRTCPTCGRPVAAEWNVCPYDGTPLS